MIIAAISGGVDSVVLLDMLTKRYPPSNIIVAHINHGIRPESGDDANFVRDLAKKYSLAYRQVDLNLGPAASEDLARRGRYEFLRNLAGEFAADIVTAHHADDIIETVAINLTRGTGWRGLAVMGANDIIRPLTTFYKQDLIQYAKKHGLTWRDDSTNNSDIYLRNRLRKKLARLDKNSKKRLLKLWQEQSSLALDIDKEVADFAASRRYFYIMAPQGVAIEVLRARLAQFGVAQTRPQLQSLLLAIKVARVGTKKSINANLNMVFSATEFWLERV